jgi:hypothetical protein
MLLWLWTTSSLDDDFSRRELCGKPHKISVATAENQDDRRFSKGSSIATSPRDRTIPCVLIFVDLLLVPKEPRQLSRSAYLFRGCDMNVAFMMTVKQISPGYCLFAGFEFCFNLSRLFLDHQNYYLGS